jgi:integrase
MEAAMQLTNKIKLTKREIDRLTAPTAGYDLYWDTELTGFGLRVTPTRKSFFVQKRVRGTRRQPRLPLGQYGLITPDQARAEAVKALGDMERGIDRIRQERAERLAGVTLEQAYVDYIKAKPLAPNTRHDYERAMSGIFRAWREETLTSITGGMVSRLFQQESQRAPVQTNRHFRFLRALLGWAMWKYARDDGTPLMPANPCDILTKLKAWNEVKRRQRYVEQAQLRPFMQAIALSPHDHGQRRDVKDLCALLTLTGLREQEGCGLRWADVDVDRCLLTVRATKNGKDHTLPIGGWLASRLAERRGLTGKSPFIFPADNAKGHLVYHRKDVLALVEASGVQFRLHDLRRTFASIVNHHLERSLSAYTIKRLMNHSSGGDVTAGYIQHPIETLREPMEMVENFVLRSAGLLARNVIAPIRKAA